MLGLASVQTAGQIVGQIATRAPAPALARVEQEHRVHEDVGLQMSALVLVQELVLVVGPVLVEVVDVQTVGLDRVRGPLVVHTRDRSVRLAPVPAWPQARVSVHQVRVLAQCLDRAHHLAPVECRPTARQVKLHFVLLCEYLACNYLTPFFCH
jgi:hypothetical protein